ncbi:MAG: hypothetical protein IPO02_16095 [Bacteroidetes bacterium]|nr:hypothetical protein [Bacteroidota bacterium]
MSKQDLTQTRVGFYVLNPTYTPIDEGDDHDLYIDQQLSGQNCKVLPIETNDSTLMNFHTLDAKRVTCERQVNRNTL